MKTEQGPIRGWKATYDMTCMDQTYEVGKTYKLPEGALLRMCESGFHFCQEQKNVLEYYDFKPEFILLEVEAIGTVLTEGDKSVTDEIRIVRIVPREEYEFMKDNVIRTKESITPYRHTWYDVEYNERNQPVRGVTQTGYTEKWEYNEDGYVLRYENSEGFWLRRGYDAAGHEVRFENSVSYWEDKKYNDKGQMIEFKSSHGLHKSYTYTSERVVITDLRETAS